MFAGFFRPRSNFYRLPNAWFDIWADIRQETHRRRILAPLKVVEYVIKWTWGYQNFDEPERISRRDFQFGKRERGQRLDRGTGLSSRSLEEALTFVDQAGVIEKERQNGDDGPSFLPRLRPAEEDPPGFLGTVSADEEGFAGFDDPEANYFKVPAIWTDLTHDAASEALILAVEYFFRHTWGWQGGGDEPCWLDVDDVANGRRYRSEERRGERYDRGTGYSERSVRDGLNEAVGRGWLVWRPQGRGREYALHLKGMQVDESGQWLKPEEAQSAHSNATTSPVPARRTQLVGQKSARTGATDETGVQAEIARLQVQVTALTQTVEALLALLRGAGIDVSAVLGESGTAETEASKALTEESKALAEASTALTEASTAPIIQTPQEDTFPTPTPDTAAPADDGGNGHGNGDGGVGGDSPVQALVGRLTSLDPPMSLEAASRLATTYGVESILAWLEALERDPTVRSVAALLIHKLRSGETPPDNGRDCRTALDKGCPFCHGTGSITPDVPEMDPDYGRTFPCPLCAPASTDDDPPCRGRQSSGTK